MFWRRGYRRKFQSLPAWILDDARRNIFLKKDQQKVGQDFPATDGNPGHGTVKEHLRIQDIQLDASPTLPVNVTSNIISTVVAKQQTTL